MRSFFQLLFGGSPSTGNPAELNSGISTTSSELNPAVKLTFEETRAQMLQGYENTQRVIQFMDAKAGAVIALSLALFAFVGKIVSWAFEKTDTEALVHLPCWMKVSLLLLGLGIFVSGFWCLDRAFRAVRPNGLPKPEYFSTLFPALKEAWADPVAIRYLDQVIAGENQGFVLREFKMQLLAVGGIVFMKIKWLRFSIRLLWFQGLFSVLLGALISYGAIFGILKKTPLARSDMSAPVVAPVSPVKSH
jgi:hypothetical protein